MELPSCLSGVSDFLDIQSVIFGFAAGNSPKAAAMLSQISKHTRTGLSSFAICPISAHFLWIFRLKSLTYSRISLKASTDWSGFLKSQDMFLVDNVCSKVQHLSIGTSDSSLLERTTRKGVVKRVRRDSDAWKDARSFEDQSNILKILVLCTGIQSLTLCFRPFPGLLAMVHAPSPSFLNLRHFRGLIDYLESDYDSLEFVYDHHRQPFPYELEDAHPISTCVSFIPHLTHVHFLLESDPVGFELSVNIELAHLTNLTHVFMNYHSYAVHRTDYDWEDFIGDEGHRGLVTAFKSCPGSLQAFAVNIFSAFHLFPARMLNGRFDSRLVFLGYIPRDHPDLLCFDQGETREFWVVVEEFIQKRREALE
ncbi:hypothetical protein C8J56DRAFT_1051313 [Mycena floridula]|nr:hypothetical protein C8J56DRAFT_1051313 [Mycena floridula]